MYKQLIYYCINSGVYFPKDASQLERLREGIRQTISVTQIVYATAPFVETDRRYPILSMNLSIFVIIVLIIYLGLSSAIARRAAETGKCGPLKSALTPLLILFYLLAAGDAGLLPGQGGRIFLILALACGCAGDTLLEISEEGKPLVFGLGSFLVGHIFYILAAASDIRAEQLTPLFLIGIIPYVILFVFVIRTILPSVPREMKAPVILYMTVIIMMSYAMLLRFGSVSMSSALICLIGSACFILSDVVLALHVFKGRIFQGVMETYTAAQLLLTCGFLFA